MDRLIETMSVNEMGVGCHIHPRHHNIRHLHQRIDHHHHAMEHEQLHLVSSPTILHHHYDVCDYSSSHDYVAQSDTDPSYSSDSSKNSLPPHQTSSSPLYLAALSLTSFPPPWQYSVPTPYSSPAPS